MAIITQDANGQLWQIAVDVNGNLTTTAVVGGIPGASGITFVSSYRVADALKLAAIMAKGVPLTGIDATICDFVSANMWKAYPWRDTLAVIPDGTYPLVDGQQDYGLAGVQMMRPTQFWIRRNDVTPKSVVNIRVAQNLAIDLYPASPYQIRSACLQPGISKLRLEKAVRIPTGSSFELGGEYQPHPRRVSDLQDFLWFADEFLEIYAKGLAYWAYRQADDKRAGEISTDSEGRARFTGMLGEFMKGLADMQAQEDFGNIEGYYPGDSMGSVDGRRWGNDLFPFLM